MHASHTSASTMAFVGEILVSVHHLECALPDISSAPITHVLKVTLYLPPVTSLLTAIKSYPSAPKLSWLIIFVVPAELHA